MQWELGAKSRCLQQWWCRFSGPRGVLQEGDAPEILDEAKGLLAAELRTFTPESRADLLEMEDEVRRVLKRYFSRGHGRRPLIVPHVFEM